MKRGRDFFFAAFSVALLVFLTILFSSCQREKPQIKIGFAGGLTGRYSDLGTAGRNGANLAVEEINQTGGIRGRQVLLISKDDKQDE
jgi:branched-chain amino acid transport system substrate-binding protein